MSRLTPIVEKLLWLNLLLFLAVQWGKWDLVNILGLRCILSENFRPYQFLTHLFIHANLRHLFSNMLILVTFGPTLESTLSSKRFFIFYLITGLGAGLLYAGIHYLEVSKIQATYHAYLTDSHPENFNTFLSKFPHTTHISYYRFIDGFYKYPDDPAYIAKSKAIMYELYQYKANIPTIGASGAILGVLTAFAMLFPNAHLFFWLLPIPIRARYFMVLYGLYELYAGIYPSPADNIAHFAHLGGILFAYLLIRWWQRVY